MKAKSKKSKEPVVETKAEKVKKIKEAKRKKAAENPAAFELKVAAERAALAEKLAAEKAAAEKLAAEKAAAEATEMLVSIVRRPGSDILLLGTGNSPIEQHPKYEELAGFAQNVANLCLSNLNLVGKLLGLNINVKIFVKAEDAPLSNVEPVGPSD